MATQAAVSNETAIFQGLSDLLRKYVIQPIVDHLATKGIQVSADELAESLKLPASQTSTSVVPAMPSVSSVPPSLSGVQGLGMPVSSRRGGKKNSNAPVTPERRCIYIFTRGRNKGRQCDAAAEPGGVFCSSCKGKKSAQQQLQNNGGAVPQTSQFSGQMVPPLPGCGSMPTQSAPPPVPTQDNKLNLSVVQVKDGLFYHPKYMIALRNLGDSTGRMLAIGVYDPQTGDVTTLTPEKIEICKELGIAYVDPNANKAPAPSPSPIPPIPGSTLPSMPRPPMGEGQTVPRLPAQTDLDPIGDPVDEEDED